MCKLLAFLVCAAVVWSSSAVASSAGEKSETGSALTLGQAIRDESQESRGSGLDLSQSTRTRQPPSIPKPGSLRGALPPAPALIPHHRSFVAFAPLQPRVFPSPFAHPRSSPILKQLGLIDEWISTQFVLAEEPKTLMAGHVQAHKLICQRFLRIYGPRHPFYRNCAFRAVELEAFLALVTKYNTEIQSTSFTRNALTRGHFCGHLISRLRRLGSLVSVAFDSYAEQLGYSEKDARFMRAALHPFVHELKALEEVVDAVDFNLSFFCEIGYLSNKSIDAASDILHRFLHLTFSTRLA